MIALAGLETLLVLSWTILGASLLALFWSGWFWSLPLFYLIATGLAAGVENTTRQSPATALGVTIHGERTYGMKLLRIGLTPPLLLLGMAGYIRCFKGKLSLPEAASGSDFRELDLQLDPRPRAIVMAGRSVAKKWVTAYSISAFIVSAAMFLLANPLIEDDRAAGLQGIHGEMSESDRELLAMYLELSSIHPDELEYHVRLASLYHRNDMLHDLRNQLEEIRRLNPEHSMLILEDTARVSFDDLLTQREADPSEEEFTPLFQPDTTVTHGDTLHIPEPEASLSTEPAEEAEPGEEPQDSLPEQEESGTPEDEHVPVQPDSL